MILKDGVCKSRVRSKGIPFAAHAGAVLGIMVWFAATSLLAEGFSQVSAALVAMPASLHASLSMVDDIGRFKPHLTGNRLHIARSDRPERLVRAARLPANQFALPPGLVPHFADIDPQRLAEQVEQPPSFLHYAWIPETSHDGEATRPADAAPVPVSGLGQRIGSAPLTASPDQIFTPMMIALAIAETEDQTNDRLTARAGDTNAGAGDDAAPVELAMAIPLPKPRPRILQSASSGAAQLQDSMPESVPASRPAPSSKKQEKQQSALSYASPDTVKEEDTSGGIFGRLFGARGAKQLPGPGAKVAVYDISSATVHMPNGEKLEAHSGLAHMQDDPGYITEKNRGPTPPNLYNLRMRESRFHGVEAIRLLPADGRKKYNRDGLLAHTYMYVGGGSRSQSNGCVVFKEYERFLKAFKKGEIERLIVVQTMDKLPTYLAAL